MTPSEALESHRRVLNDVGRDIIVRRWSGPSDARVHTDVTTRARVIGYAPEKVVGAVEVGDRKVIALVDSLSSMLPLLDSDKVVIDGVEFGIRFVDDQTRRIAGTLIALEIQIAG